MNKYLEALALANTLVYNATALQRTLTDQQPTSEQQPTENREFTLRVRLTPGEQSQLQAGADATGMSLSEYVRRKIFTNFG